MPTKLIQHATHAMGCACLQVAGPAALRLGRAGALQIAIVQPGSVDRYLDPRDVADPWTTAVTWFPPASAAFDSGQLAIDLDYAVTYHLRANQPYRLLLRAEGAGEAEERFTGIGNIRRPSAPPAGWAPPPDPTATLPETQVPAQAALPPAPLAAAAPAAATLAGARHPVEAVVDTAPRPEVYVAPPSAPEPAVAGVAATGTPGAVSMLAPRSEPSPAPAAPAAQARATTQAFCTQCGATLKAGAAFCIGCGARAGAAAAVAAVATPAAAVTDPPAVAPTPPAAPPPASTSGGGNTALIVAIVVGVFVVLIGAGLFVAAMIEEANLKAEAEQVRLREERERAEKQAAEARQRADAEARRRRDAEERARQQREAQERAAAESARQQREAQERAAAEGARRQREAQERASLEAAQRQQVAAMLAEGERCFAASRFDCAIAHANSALQVIPGEPRAQELRYRATENQRRANQGVQIR